MARKRRRGKPKKRMAVIVASVCLLLVLGVAMAFVPGFEAWLFRIAGIDKETRVPPVSGLSNSPVAVHFIDVGQGDAVLLEADGEFALIDAGTPEAQGELTAYLKEAGVEKLRYVFMSHPHADHIGGMQAVLEGIPTEKLVLPDLDKAPYPTSSLFLGVLETALAQGIPTEKVKTGNIYALGSGQISILAGGLATEDNYNLLSPAILFEAAGLRFLDTGDAEAKNERAMLEEGAHVRANLFKAGHHGSSTSNTEDFLAAVAPSLVVASCGRNNSYGHPHREVVLACEEAQAGLLRTDVNGSVVVKPGEKGELVYATAR